MSDDTNDTITAPSQADALAAAVAAAKQRQTARAQKIADLRESYRIAAEIEAKQNAPTFGSFVGDVAHNAIDLPIQLVRGVAEGLAEMPQAFADFGKVGPQIHLHIPGTGTTHEDLINEGLSGVHNVAQAGIDAVTEKPRTGAGSMAEGIGRFMSAFIPAGEVIKGAEWAAKLGKYGELGANLTKGAIADLSALDPAQENLTALLREHTGLKDPVTAFLATNPNDPAAENRLRNAVEGLGIGGAIDGLVAGLKVLRSARAAKAASETEEAARAEARDLKVPEEAPKEPVQEPAASTNNGQPAPVDKPTEAGSKVEPLITVEQHQVDAAAGTAASPTGQVSNAIRATGQDGLTDFNAQRVDWQSFGEKADDVFNVIETTSRVFADQIDQAKGGVQSFADTTRLAGQVAELTGGDVGNIVKTFTDTRGEVGLAARLMAAHQTMLASAQRVSTIAKQVMKGDLNATIELRKAVEQHAAIQAYVKGATSEVGRALNALKIYRTAAEGVDWGDLNLIDKGLIKKLAGEKNLVKLNRAVRDAGGKRWHDYALEVWVNGLLSGPVTHLVNFASNAVKATTAVPERFVAGAFGAVRRSLGQNVETVRMRESLSLAAGMYHGLIDAIRIPGTTALKNLASATATSIRTWDASAVRQALDAQNAEFGTVYRALARGEGVTDAAVSKLERAQKGPALQWDTSTAEGAARAGLHVANAIGTVVRLPGHALMAGDELFKTIAYRQELHALATRRSIEAGDPSLYGKLIKSPPEELHLAAIEHARRQTFTQSPGAFAQWLQQGAARFPAMRLIVPFIRTPANMLRDMYGYTPGATIFSPIKFFRDTLLKGGPQADLALARMTLGTGALAAVWELAEAGHIVGGGPDGRDSTELSNISPYSIRFGDKWYQFNRLDPMGMLIGATADLHDIVHRQWDQQGENHNIANLAQLIAISAAKNAASKTWLSGISAIATAASDPERYGGNFMERMGASMMPFVGASKWATALSDPAAHEVFTFADRLRSQVPGLSKDLPLLRDYLGQPVPNGRPRFNPLYMSEETTDPVRKELSKLSFDLQMPPRNLDGVPLTAAQHSRLLELRGTVGVEGQKLHDKLLSTISGSAYQNLPHDLKVEEVKKVVNGYNRAATGTLITEDHELKKAWLSARISKKTGIPQ